MIKNADSIQRTLAVLCVITSASMSLADDYDVYLLSGQSNMDGYGLNAELPDAMRKPVKGVMIFHGSSGADGDLNSGRGKWATLQPGHGAGFQSDGKENQYGDRFGPELGFAARIRELRPDRKIAIIKYSRGGTSIAIEADMGAGCWHPDFDRGDGEAKGDNQYDHCLTTIRNAFAQRDIDADGTDDQLLPAGIVWMQGESDAYKSADIARAYEKNLERLMELLSAALRKDDLPVAIGRISDSGQDKKDGKIWDHGDIVRAGQKQYTDAHRNAALVTATDNYKYSDPYHYDSAGFVDLGRQFAEAIVSVTKTKKSEAPEVNADRSAEPN